jgi:hypothetical protein
VHVVRMVSAYKTAHAASAAPIVSETEMQIQRGMFSPPIVTCGPRVARQAPLHAFAPLRARLLIVGSSVQSS